MKLPLSRLVALTLIAGLAGLASAQTVADPAAPAPGSNTPRVDQRQENQEKRIEAGQQQGQLTRREAHRLERRHGAIGKAEERAKADGSVSVHERRRLHKAQNAASRDIRHQRHDRQAPLAGQGG